MRLVEIPSDPAIRLLAVLATMDDALDQLRRDGLDRRDRAAWGLLMSARGALVGALRRFAADRAEEVLRWRGATVRVVIERDDADVVVEEGRV